MTIGNPTTVKRILQEVIYYHLDNYSFSNALFFAEKLVAFDSRSPQSKLLLSLCHFKLDDYHSALEAVNLEIAKASDLGCIWIYSQCCFALKKYKDGVAALEMSKDLWPQTTRIGRGRNSVRYVSPDRPALLCLMGRFYRQLDNIDKAITHFELALKENPFMWDAFVSLCDMGVVISVPSVFKLTESLTKTFSTSRENFHAGAAGITTNSPLWKFSARASSKTKDASGNKGDNHQAPSTSRKPAGCSATQPDEDKAALSAMAALNLDAAEVAVPLPGEGDSNLRDFQPDVFRESMRKARKQVTELATAGVLPRMTQRMGNKKNSKREGKVETGEKQRIQETHRMTSLSSTPTKGRKRLRSEDWRHVKPPCAEEADISRDHSSASSPHASTTCQTPSIHQESHNASNTCPPRAEKKVRRLLPNILPSSQKGSKKPSEISGEGSIQRRYESHGVDAVKSGTSTYENWIVKPLPLMEKRQDNNPKLVDGSLKWLLNLLRTLGVGYYSLSRFQCDKALKAYNQLPYDQGQTPWVLGQMGRAYFEQGSYHQAERVFRALREIAPTRHRDMEVYSTILWHLDRQAELSFLSHELLDLSWRSPEA